MNNTLKCWLVDNTVTTDNKEDKILLLESAGSSTLTDIIAAMRRAVSCRRIVLNRINKHDNE